MNKIIKTAILASLFCAGCATVQKEESAVDPNPYATYGAAMSNKGGKSPQAAVWQKEERAKIDAATTKEALAKISESEASATAFLKQIKGAYDTDAIVATQAAAVTQLMMCRKWSEAPKRREYWVAALKKALAETDDAYRKAFFRDQLRQCGVK